MKRVLGERGKKKGIHILQRGGMQGNFGEFFPVNARFTGSQTADQMTGKELGSETPENSRISSTSDQPTVYSVATCSINMRRASWLTWRVFR